jgi:hypothetical protein
LEGGFAPFQFISPSLAGKGIKGMGCRIKKRSFFIKYPVPKPETLAIKPKIG